MFRLRLGLVGNLLASMPIVILALTLVLLILAGAAAGGGAADAAATDAENEKGPVPYGTEISWPMQHLDRLQFFMTHKQFRPYVDLAFRGGSESEFMAECRKAYSDDLCDTNKQERIAINAAQPALQRNFTSAGYAKVSAPSQSFAALLDFWDSNYYRYDHNNHQNLVKEEEWQKGSVYTNHWKAPSRTLLVDPSLDVRVRRQLIKDVQNVLEHWSGVPLVPTSMYGIRAYSRGTILAPHVDRLPLVISAIINVAQEGMEEEWPLEVIGHDGNAVNVTMQPGEMILYESHSVLHGRPFSLRGNLYANLFLHYEPIGYTAEFEQKQQWEASHSQQKRATTAKDKFEAALLRSQQQSMEEEPSVSVSSVSSQQQQQQSSQSAIKKKKATQLPHYIKEGTLEADRWLQNFVFQRRDMEAEHAALQKTNTARSDDRHSPSRNVHHVAAVGNVRKLRQIANQDPASMDKADSNGWKPIHGACAIAFIIVCFLYSTSNHLPFSTLRLHRSRTGWQRRSHSVFD